MKFDSNTGKIVDKLTSISGQLSELSDHIRALGIDYENKGNGMQRYDAVCAIGSIRDRLTLLLEKLENHETA
jgi:hypothetical protein